MSILKSPWGRGIGFGLSMAVCMGFWATSFADIVHFANGNSVRGKLDRLTGDIIEFRRSKHLFGNLDYFKRIQLTDRHDVVETHDGQKYFGEIIYLDDFMIEIQTGSGSVRINRIRLTNVVLGSPLQAPNVPSMSQVPVRSGGMPPEPPTSSTTEEPSVRTVPMTTISHTSQSTSNEDEDAIPAVDSGPLK
jgi:hypothetical protein